MLGEVIYYGNGNASGAGSVFGDPSLYGSIAASASNKGQAAFETSAIRCTSDRINPPFSSNTNIKNNAFGSYHAGGAQFVLGDGSVRFISDNIDQSYYPDPGAPPYNLSLLGLYQRLGHRFDGRPLGEF